MEGKMSFPEQFIGSVFKFNSYKHFYKRTLGRAFFYLFLASIILAGLGGLRTLVVINAEIDGMIKAIKTEMPHFELRNGELFVDAKMPYIVSEASDHIIIIDTTGQTDQSILEDYSVGILLTRSDMYQKQNRFEIRQFDLNVFTGLNFTRADLIRWSPMFKWIIAFIALFGFMFYFLGKLISALIIAAGGLIIENSARCKIGFGNLYKLSLYALTLPMIIQTVLNVAQVTVPLFFVIYYGIALFYLYKAVAAVCSPPGGEAGSPYSG